MKWPRVEKNMKRMFRNLPAMKLPDEGRRKFIAWLYNVPAERRAAERAPAFRRPAYAGAALATVFVCVLCYNYLFSPLSPVVANASGTVKVYSAAKNEWMFADGRRMKLAKNDILKTFGDGQADLVINGLYQIRLKNDSEIRLARSISRAGGGDIRYELAKGKAYTYYDKRRKYGRELDIATEQAMVSCLGTDFMVETGAAKTWVGVLDGMVRVTGVGIPDLDKRVGASVLVEPGERTVVRKGSAPEKPVRLLENELMELEELYRIGTRPRVALLISSGSMRTRELLSLTLLYISAENEGALPQELVRIARTFREAIKARTPEKYLESVRQFEAVVNDNPNPKYDVQFLLFIGAYYKYFGEYQKAIDTFRKVIDRYPRSGLASVAQCAIGIIYEEKLNDPGKAKAAYQKVMSGYPASPEREEALAGLRRLAAPTAVSADTAAFAVGKYRRNYAKGVYRTSVRVAEGMVIVAPYDEKTGPDYGRGIALSAGQKTEITEAVQ